jgi:ADP-ribose pyrophosphatase YjhB (NUDIX family)
MIREPLPQEEFTSIFSRVPRLTVEVLIATKDRGVLLGLRDVEPCRGTWNLPGGTVRFGEPAVDAVKRVALGELGLTVSVGELMGYIEYPSHYQNGLDSPVGLVFRAGVVGVLPDRGEPPNSFQWFQDLPENMHDEQKAFLVQHVPGLSAASGRRSTPPPLRDCGRA